MHDFLYSIIKSIILIYHIGFSHSFEEIIALQVDLEAILDGLDLDENIAKFAKGILAFEGTAKTQIQGGLSLTLGLGLEYDKIIQQTNVYIKGNTGLELSFGIDATSHFSASIGSFSGDVSVDATVDNAGTPLTISFGLEDSLSYILSSDKTLERPSEGFVVATIGEVVDELSVAVQGQVEASVGATIAGGIGFFNVDLSISDINSEYL